MFCIYCSFGVKLFTRVRLQTFQFNEHKFRHGFHDAINPMCAYRTEVKTTEHFPLLFHFYGTQIFELFKNLKESDPNFLDLSGQNQGYIS